MKKRNYLPSLSQSYTSTLIVLLGESNKDQHVLLLNNGSIEMVRYLSWYSFPHFLRQLPMLSGNMQHHNKVFFFVFFQNITKLILCNHIQSAKCLPYLWHYTICINVASNTWTEECWFLLSLLSWSRSETQIHSEAYLYSNTLSVCHCICLR